MELDNLSPVYDYIPFFLYWYVNVTQSKGTFLYKLGSISQENQSFINYTLERKYDLVIGLHYE